MKKNKKEIPFWAQCNHKKPTTRREFLAFAGGSFAASLAAPSIASALNCPSAGLAPGMVPFISVQLVGGAAMSANFLPMGADGAPIADRSRMGLGKGDIAIEKAFGGATFAGNGISHFLTGMKETMSTQAQSKTSFVGICVSSFDDSSKNPFDPTGLLVHSGYSGSLMPHINKFQGTNMRARPAMVSPPSPFAVSSVADIGNVLNYSGVLSKMSANEKGKLASLISKLNRSQTQKLARHPAGNTVKTLFDCAGLKNQDLVTQGGGDGNPFKNGHKARSAFQKIWGTNINGADNLYGAMAYNNLLGHSGPAHIALGGYDYHNGSRSTGNDRDKIAGVLMGRLISSAEYLNKPVFIMVFSDGSVGSPNSAEVDAPWTTDFGRAGAVYMISYHPTKRPTTSKNQLGTILPSQASDENFILGANPERATLGVFANYCSMIGRMDLLDSLPRKPFETEELDQVLAFHKG